MRERVRKCREKKRDAQTQSNDLIDSFKNSYRNKQTLLKATKKLSLALPKSSPKKAVLAKILEDYNENDRNELMNVIKLTQNAKQTVRNIELITEIQNFFQRDDISRTSPKMKDVKQYTCPVSGERVLKPKKHMILTIRESYAIFVEEQKAAQKGKFKFISMSLFIRES